MPDVPGSGGDLPAETKVAGIIGGEQQVARSISPALHNAAFNALGIDWVYRTFGFPEIGLTGNVDFLVSIGVVGMNVTMPHKVAVLDAMDRLSDAAMAIGAVNTIEVRPDGALVGHNTDGEGLTKFLELDAGVILQGSTALVVGAGGSARAVVHALGKAGAELILVAARDPGKANALRSVGGDSNVDIVGLSDLVEPTRSATIIINATPIGQQGESSPVAAEHLGPGAVVVDLVYSPPVTPLIQAARARGVVAHSGLGMLLHQAALSFEIWTGVQPPLDVMSAAALAAIGSQAP